MRTLTASWVVMWLLLALDQASKLWVRDAIPLYRSTVLIPNFIDLTHVKNPGVSFSFLGNLPDGLRVPLLAGISLVAVILLSVYWLRHRAGMNAMTEWAFLLILPGAVGNLIDRVGFGVVTDFFHFRIGHYSLFVNNIADIFISVGVGCYLVGLLLARRKERAEEAREG
jgi:signal peptidase II